MNKRERDRIIARCERFVVGWNAPRDPAAEFRELADRAGAHMDVYGGGDSVKRLESRVAKLLGKETAVLFPSGTMAQQIALRIWCDRKGCSTVGSIRNATSTCTRTAATSTSTTCTRGRSATVTA